MILKMICDNSLFGLNILKREPVKFNIPSVLNSLLVLRHVFSVGIFCEDQSTANSGELTKISGGWWWGGGGGVLAMGTLRICGFPHFFFPSNNTY